MSVFFLLILIVGAILAVLAIAGIAIFVLKIGVIASEASRPPHQDHGTYTLEQGREVRPEERNAGK